MRAQEMKPHGLLFKSDMILALLNTMPDIWPATWISASKPFKWQTRRGIKHPEYFGCLTGDCPHDTQDKCDTAIMIWAQENAPHPVGQIVYAREAFAVCDCVAGYWTKRSEMAAKHVGGPHCKRCGKPLKKWKPGIHMPKEIATLWFVVQRVRVERVNTISEADAIAEGISWPDRDGKPYRPPIDTTGMSKLRIAGDRYRELFDSINGAGAFERGDYCWVYDLARISKPTDL